MNESLLKQNEVLLNQTKEGAEYNAFINKNVIDLVSKADQSIQTQVYSSAMIENLINDLLDLAKLENCKFELNNEPFNLVQVISGSFHILHNMAKQRGITLRAVIDIRPTSGSSSR